jgi:hypothetical protein
MFACACDMTKSLTSIKNLSENRRYVLKIQTKVYLSEFERRLQYCLRSAESAKMHAKQCRLQFRWENLN